MCKFKVGDELFWFSKCMRLVILGVFDKRECRFDGSMKIYVYRDADGKGIIRYCDAAAIDDECKLI